MAVPRVFVSSTCYDLKYIRENIKYFIKTIGYEPVLSDNGDVYYNPSSHTHDACLNEVSTCQIFVLIIGGRYGGKFKEKEHSITNYEYKQAIKSNIPIFALVETDVYSDNHLFSTNKKKNPDFYNKISYPNVDSIKIFDFIDEVRKAPLNNAIQAFKDFSDIEIYLKKQWAGMMYDFLDKSKDDTQAIKTNKLLANIEVATEKSEKLIEALLRASHKEEAKEIIQNIDKKIEAENFVRYIFDKLQISSVYTTIEICEKAIIHKKWFDFLVEINKIFYIETLEYERITTTYIHHDTSIVFPEYGICINHYPPDDLVISENKIIIKLYSALQSLTPEARRPILLKLINGLNYDYDFDIPF